ncbi:hypothetical protein D3C74_397020 [compost metagenome]
MCTVNERNFDVVFRAYSGKFKTSFIEIIFDWNEMYYVNLNRPSVRERLIHYSIKHGWRPLDEKQILRISYSGAIIDQLSLRDCGPRQSRPLVFGRGISRSRFTGHILLAKWQVVAKPPSS